MAYFFCFFYSSLLNITKDSIYLFLHFSATTAFGAKPATSNVFGQSTFGVSTPNTGGLFGNTSQPAGSGLFGQPSSTFGAPASTSTGSFGKCQ